MGAKASKQYQQEERLDRSQHRQIKVTANKHSRRTSPAHRVRKASLDSSCSTHTLSSSSSSSVEFRHEQMPATILPLSQNFLSSSQRAARDDYAISDDDKNISTVTASSSGFNSSDITALFSQIDSASSIAGDSIASRATTVSSRSSSMRGDKFLPPPYSPGQFTKDNYLQIINGLIPVSSSGSTNVREDLLDSPSTSNIQLPTQSELQMLPADSDDNNSSIDGSIHTASTSASQPSILSSSSSNSQHQLSHEVLLAELRHQRKVNSWPQNPIASTLDVKAGDLTEAKTIQSILQVAFTRAQALDSPAEYIEAYQATRCYADETNDPVARIWVAQCHLNGWGVPRNPTFAFQTLSSMARRNIIDAYYPTGCCYYDGAGVSQDKKKAFYWFELAANSGDAMAQYRVGSMLAKGEGVEEDETQAFEWFKNGADNGSK
jgi:hypothetical protein